MKKADYLWKDRKRTIFGLPWSFTRYRLTNEKMLIETGFFTRQEEEIRLYRILDITLRRSFRERIFGLGTIHCCSADKTTPEFDIRRIKKSSHTKDMLSDIIEEQRMAKRVSSREFMSDMDDDEEN